jgi:uncharacterized protein YodC (DUF2158 family)
MWKRLQNLLFKSNSRFNQGDAVELVEGGDLMVVEKIITGSKLREPMVMCKWYDSSTRTNRKNIFNESKLRLIDWHGASDRLRGA